MISLSSVELPVAFPKATTRRFLTATIDAMRAGVPPMRTGYAHCYRRWIGSCAELYSHERNDKNRTQYAPPRHNRYLILNGFSALSLHHSSCLMVVQRARKKFCTSRSGDLHTSSSPTQRSSPARPARALQGRSYKLLLDMRLNLGRPEVFVYD